MNYNFDEIVNRQHTNCIKYDMLDFFFGADDILPMWVADTDFRTPDFIMEAIRERAQHEVLGYSFRPDSYYEAIIGWMQRRHNWAIEKEWITFSPGVVAGITLAIEALTKPGDKIVVQPPVYFPFFDSVKGTGRTMVENPLMLKNGRYYFDLDDLKAKIDENTKMLILCNPHNPGGMVWSKEELEELGDMCVEHNMLIVSDEIHLDLTFKGHTHTPMASVSEKIAKNTITCTAPSKTFNTAGLTSSMVIISNKRYRAAYERKLNVPHLNMGNIFGTVATEVAYTHGDAWVDQLMGYVEENYYYLESYFAEHIPQVKVMKPEATFLVWLDCSALGVDDVEFHELLAKQFKIGLNDGPRFGTGGAGFVRINIGCPRPILKEGLSRIEKAVKSLENG